MVVKTLIDWTGDPLAPAWYICAIVAIVAAAMIAVRESSPYGALSKAA
jgi:hypothetical protein